MACSREGAYSLAEVHGLQGDRAKDVVGMTVTSNYLVKTYGVTYKSLGRWRDAGYIDALTSKRGPGYPVVWPKEVEVMVQIILDHRWGGTTEELPGPVISDRLRDIWNCLSREQSLRWLGYSGSQRVFESCESDPGVADLLERYTTLALIKIPNLSECLCHRAS